MASPFETAVRVMADLENVNKQMDLALLEAAAAGPVDAETEQLIRLHIFVDYHKEPGRADPNQKLTLSQSS